MDMHPKGHVVGCGVQGRKCLAIDLSQGKGGKWAINWSLAGDLGDEAFAARLSKLTGRRHFWVSPSEEGGLQVETARAIEIPPGNISGKGSQEGFFLTQIRSRFVNETVVFGGMRMKGVEMRQGAAKKGVHNVGGGAIKDNVQRDYLNWYRMGVRRPHIASTALALANAYLALYPEAKRLFNPLRLIVLKGRSVYRAVLMDDWKYIDEVLLPRMEGDNASASVIDGRMRGWIDYFKSQHPVLTEGRDIDPLVISVEETHVSAYEHWDLWDEQAVEKIEMTGEVAEPILLNRDIAPIAFGMALQGGC
jgi:hypothetical protein